jgi:hypothetical protein
MIGEVSTMRRINQVPLVLAGGRDSTWRSEVGASGWVCRRVTGSGIVLAVLGLLGVLCAAGWGRETAEWVIQTPSARMSPDDKYLAFWAGPRPPGGQSPQTLHARLFFLDLDAGEMICCRDLVLGSGALAWEPKGAMRLFVCQDCYTETGNLELAGGRLVAFTPSESPEFSFAKTVDPNELLIGNTMSALSWSPDGRVLASAGGMLAPLYLSFDGGESFIRAGEAQAVLWQLWTDNETLVVQRWVGGNRSDIVELKIGACGIESMRAVVPEPESRLCDAWNGRAIIRGKNRVYVDEAVFFETEHRIGPVLGDGDYIAITLWPEVGDERIAICDRKGNLVNEWPVPKTTILMGLSSKRRCVYLEEIRPLRVLGYRFRKKGWLRKGWELTDQWRVPRVRLPDISLLEEELPDEGG